MKAPSASKASRASNGNPDLPTYLGMTVGTVFDESPCGGFDNRTGERCTGHLKLGYTRRRGGGHFLGCTEYPRCRYVENLDKPTRNSVNERPASQEAIRQAANVPSQGNPAAASSAALSALAAFASPEPESQASSEIEARMASALGLIEGGIDTLDAVSEPWAAPMGTLLAEIRDALERPRRRRREGRSGPAPGVPLPATSPRSGSFRPRAKTRPPRRTRAAAIKAHRETYLDVHGTERHAHNGHKVRTDRKRP